MVAELDGAGHWARGYVYLGGELLAVQQGGVFWSHQEPVVKSRRVTDGAGNVTSAVELDPWGGATGRMWNAGQQPRWFTSYLRDGVGSDEAMHRRYNRYYSRFEQPDPYDGSYDLSDPQSLNRYAYTQNDPVNFVDPLGLTDDVVSVYTWTYPWVSLPSSYDLLGGGRGGADMFLTAETAGTELGGDGIGGSQNPFPPPPPNCEDQLAKLFGDRSGKPGARMSITTDISTGGYRGYDPKVPASADPDMQHLYFFPHLTSPDGNERTPVFVPGDFKYIGQMTIRKENGPIRMFYSAKRDATVFITHLADFNKGIRAGDRFRVGYTGGKGGDTAGNLHVHFAVHKGRGFNASNRVPFSTIFCK